MKRIITLLLAFGMVVILCACGGEKTGENKVDDEENYSIGDTVSTDVMECTLLSVERDEKGYIHVSYSIKNIGKNSLSEAWVMAPDSVSRKLDGLTSLDYNDGYIYDQHTINTLNNKTFLDLVPLSDEVIVKDVYSDIPDEVWTNESALLLVKVYLYSEAEEGNRDIDEAWADVAKDAAKHTKVFTFKVR